MLSDVFVSDSIPIPNIAPEGMAWDGSNLWVTDGFSNSTFNRISVNTKTVIGTGSNPSPATLTKSGLTRAEAASVSP